MEPTHSKNFKIYPPNPEQEIEITSVWTIRDGKPVIIPIDEYLGLEQVDPSIPLEHAQEYRLRRLSDE